MSNNPVLALAIAIVLGGCGKSDDATPTSPSAEPAAPAAAPASPSSSNVAAAARIAKAMAMPDPQPIDIDPCTLITVEEAGTVLSTIRETKSRGGEGSRPFRECFHTGGTIGTDSVLIAVAGGLDMSQFDAYVMGNAELTGDENNLQSIEGLGDKAYWNRNFLWVHSGPATLYVSVSTRDLREDTASLEAAKQFAAKAITRL